MEKQLELLNSWTTSLQNYVHESVASFLAHPVSLAVT